MPVSSTIKAALATGHVAAWWCVEVGFGTPLRLTDCGEPLYVTADSAWYTPHQLAVSISVQMIGGTVQVVLDDDGTLEALEAAQPAAGRTLRVFRVFVTTTGQEVEVHWDGLCESAEVGEDGRSITFTGGAAGLLAVGPGSPILTNRCAHDFMGPGCTYAGAETACDGSYDRCGVLGNRLNFVSALWAPEPGTTVVIDGDPYVIPQGMGGGNHTMPASSNPGATPPPYVPPGPYNVGGGQPAG